jgi:four helix bundle protein
MVGMSRDHRKLRVFVLADKLVLQVYKASAQFPVAERFGIQSQMRRSALSVASNIVEGSARRTQAEYAHFLNIAASSAAETEYLLDISKRLCFLSEEMGTGLEQEYQQLAGGLQALLNSMRPEL